MLRFVYKVGHPSDQKDGALTVAELRAAERKWVHDRQLHGFNEEIANNSAYMNNRTLLAHQLRLSLNDKDLLRCGRRFAMRSSLMQPSFQSYFQKNNYLTNTHARQLEAGVNSTHTALR